MIGLDGQGRLFCDIIILVKYHTNKPPYLFKKGDLFMKNSDIRKVTGCLHTKEGRNNYYVVLSSYDDKGKRIRKSVYTDIPIKGDTRRKAKAKLAEILAEYSDECVDFSKDADFMDFMEEWLETLKVSIASTTHNSYRYTLTGHILPYFKPRKLKVKDVTPAVIQKYVNDKLKEGLSPNTVRKHLFNISKCLDSAVRQNIIAFNPVKRIEMPKKERYTGAKYYNESQIEKLLEVSKGGILEIVILLTLFYGLRRSEVLGLRWDAVDFENKTITISHTVVIVGKTVHRQDRTKNDASHAPLPLPSKIALQLLEWKERQQELKALQPNDYQDSGYICTKLNGEPLPPNFVTQHFTLLLKKNDMPRIRFHDLRHSSASYLKYLGFDLKEIQTWLRHKDIQTTMNIYTHLDMEAKENIANSLDARFELLKAK